MKIFIFIFKAIFVDNFVKLFTINAIRSLERRHSSYNSTTMRPINLPTHLDSPYHFYQRGTGNSSSSSPVLCLDRLIPSNPSVPPVLPLFPAATTTSPTMPLPPTHPATSTMPPLSSAFPVDPFLSTSYYFPFPDSQVPPNSIFVTPNNSAFQTPTLAFSGRHSGLVPNPLPLSMPKLQPQSSISAESTPSPLVYDALNGLAAQIPNFNYDFAQAAGLGVTQIPASVTMTVAIAVSSCVSSSSCPFPNSSLGVTMRSGRANGNNMIGVGVAADFGNNNGNKMSEPASKRSMSVSSIFGADSDDGGESLDSEGYVLDIFFHLSLWLLFIAVPLSYDSLSSHLRI